MVKNVFIGNLKTNVSGNAGGVRIIGREIDGIRVGNADITASGNATGFSVSDMAHIDEALDMLGLPRDTYQRAVGKLLQEVVQAPVEEREKVATRSELFHLLSEKVADVTAFAANLVTLSGQPTIQRLIGDLLA